MPTMPPALAGSPRTSPLAWSLVGTLVTLIPAAGAVYGARTTLAAFEAMARYQGPYGNRHGGTQAVAETLLHANAPLLWAAIVGTALAVGRSLAARRVALGPAGLQELLACVAGLPAVLVYLGESAVLNGLSGGPGASVAGATEHLTTLLWCAIALGSTTGLLGVSALGLKRSSPAAGERVTSSAALWALAAALMCSVAGAFALRSAHLHAAVLAGQF